MFLRSSFFFIEPIVSHFCVQLAGSLDSKQSERINSATWDHLKLKKHEKNLAC